MPSSDQEVCQGDSLIIMIYHMSFKVVDFIMDDSPKESDTIVEATLHGLLHLYEPVWSIS